LGGGVAVVKEIDKEKARRRRGMGRGMQL